MIWTVVIAIVLYAFFYARGYDDPYITYHYSANLARGAGFVFNPNERILSTTTPLYTLLLALAGWVNVDIPLTSTLIGCVSLAVGGWVFWQLGRYWRTPIVGVLGLLLYPTHPLLTVTLSNETALCLTLCLLGLMFIVQHRFMLAAFWLALATLARHDSVIMVGLCGLYLLNQHFRNRGLSTGVKRLSFASIVIFALTYVTLLLPWFVFAWVYFGNPLPITLMVKQQQGKMAISDPFLRVFLAYSNYYVTYPTYWAQSVFMLIGGVTFIFRRTAWAWVVAWSALYTAAYTALNVPGYFWYFGPVAPGLVALVVLGCDCFWGWAKRILGAGHKLRQNGVFLLMVMVLFLPQLRSAYQLKDLNDNRLGLYRKTGEWLRANTPPTASVGTLEVGIIGYYAQRRLIDFAGLLQPDVAMQMTHDSTYDTLALGAFERYKPNYLALFEGTFQPIRASQHFVKFCAEATVITDNAHPMKMQIYKCD